MMTFAWSKLNDAAAAVCGPVRGLAALGALALLVPGCAPTEAEFSNREDFTQLMPEAQEYVHKVLETHFGHPTQVVAWERLPLKLHAAVGTVAAGSAADALILNFTQRNLPIERGNEVTFLSGALLQKPGAWVEQFDDVNTVRLADRDENGELTAASLSATPAEGDRVAIGPGEVLQNGRLLFAEHCLHCHGVTGDGNGPTAPYLNPHPRDFRRGIFKFTTTTAANRAQRTDLSRTIEDGIPGTYMPSFKLFTPDENMAIVEYVLWLSMRGEIEYQLVGQLKNEYSNDALKERVEGGESRQDVIQELTDAVNGGDMQEQLDGTVELVTSRWTESQAEEAVVAPSVNRPPSTPESIARGRALYLSKDLNCTACHGEAALGDGPQTYSITKNAAGEDNPTPGLYDEWGNLIKPRNLTQGIYRGGRRPIDLFCRLHGGIKGTPMPAFGGKKTDEELWDVVNYILSVPFEKREAGDGSKEPRPEPATSEVAHN